MLDFVFHESIEKEISKQERRFRRLREAIERFQLICEKQFHPLSPTQVIPPAKLHRLKQNDSWSLWKIELMVPGSGLRPNQMPRIWFAVKGSFVAFLCLGCHADNYEDNEREATALERVTDIF